MQYVKLSIPFLNQTFLLKHNFKEITYEELVEVVKQKLNRKIKTHFFYYKNDEIEMRLNNQETLQQIKERLDNQLVVKLTFIEIEDKVPMHPYACNNCNVFPIPHIRYRCFVCSNLNFCEQCLEHAKIHPMVMFTTPEQESYTTGFFQKSMQHVSNMLQKSISCSKLKISDFVQSFKERKENQKQAQFQKKIDEQEEINEIILKLSEIFEGEPLSYLEFVQKNKGLSFEDLVEKASMIYG